MASFYYKSWQLCTFIFFLLFLTGCQAARPTEPPTNYPSIPPSRFPTVSPSKNPTQSPTKAPSISPTTVAPTAAPVAPTPSPTAKPTLAALATICVDNYGENRYGAEFNPSSTGYCCHFSWQSSCALSCAQSKCLKKALGPGTYWAGDNSMYRCCTATSAPSPAPTSTTMNPTLFVSSAPTLPTTNPSTAPVLSPTLPTNHPSAVPTVAPSSAMPTVTPSVSPTTPEPSASPTLRPTYNPTHNSPDVSHLDLFFMTIVGNYMTATNSFALLVMTQSDNYIKINLNRVLESPLNPSFISDIRELSEYSRCDGSDSKCVSFWQIDYTQDCDSLQLSGDWKMQFMLTCVGSDYLNKKECLDSLDANDLGTNKPVSLTVSNFEFEDKICDETLYSNEFVPQFTYYKDSSLTKERSDTVQYKGGETVYVKVDVEDVTTSNGFNVSAVDINNVFICALDDDFDDNVNEISGCLLTDTLVVISDGESGAGFNAGVISDGAFSFRISSDIAACRFISQRWCIFMKAEEITIQIQATLTVQSSIGRRRLLTTQQAKQMRHFTTSISFNPNAIAKKSSAGSGLEGWFVAVLIGAVLCLGCHCAVIYCCCCRGKKKGARVDIKSDDDFGDEQETEMGVKQANTFLNQTNRAQNIIGQ